MATYWSIPKKADYVTVNGQVFNPTAVSYRPGRSAQMVPEPSGGTTQLANKKAIFVIRADGSVLAAKNNDSGWWSGDPLGGTLRPGDSIVVPEIAPRIGTRNWQNLVPGRAIGCFGCTGGCVHSLMMREVHSLRVRT